MLFDASLLIKDNQNLIKSEGIITTLMKLLTQKLDQLSNETVNQIQSSNTQQLNNLTVHIFDIENEQDIVKILKIHIVHVKKAISDVDMITS
ncbi:MULTISPECIES: DUF4351 domain-containing protein [Bacillota]